MFDKQPEGRKRNLKAHTTKTQKFSDQNNNKNGNFVKKQFNIEDDLVCPTEKEQNSSSDVSLLVISN